MTFVPRRLLMTDYERELFYGPKNPFLESRFQALEKMAALSEREMRELQHYRELWEQIKERTPDYKAIARNAGLETAAALLEGICIPLMIGGMRIYFDGIRDRKQLPYKSSV